jgi:hypothetical protein
MEFTTTKGNVHNNAVKISLSDFLAIYNGAPWDRENMQLYFDGMAVTVFEYDDKSVTLESTFNINLFEMFYPAK